MEVESFLLAGNGWVPNNGRLPVLVYRSVFAGGAEPSAGWFEARFAEHGWPPRWRDGVFDYHHYHSTAHEALGVASGTATLMLGGPDGREVEVAAGDALVLPVGTGHRRISADADFLVVGAYPAGQDWDICRDAPKEKALLRMRLLLIPGQDPIGGLVGPLVDLWQAG